MSLLIVDHWYYSYSSILRAIHVSSPQTCTVRTICLTSVEERPCSFVPTALDSFRHMHIPYFHSIYSFQSKVSITIYIYVEPNMPSRSPCSNIVKPKQPWVQALRKLVRCFLGAWTGLIGGPHPPSWPQHHGFPPSIDGTIPVGYSALTGDMLLDVTRPYAS